MGRGLPRLEQEPANTRHAALLEALGALDHAGKVLGNTHLPRARFAADRARRAEAKLREVLGIRPGATSTLHQSEAN